MLKIDTHLDHSSFSLRALLRLSANRIEGKAGLAGQPSLLCESSPVLFTAVSWICLRSTADGVIWKDDGAETVILALSGLLNVIKKLHRQTESV